MQEFDALGKLAKVIDSSGVQTFEYDELDNNTQTVFEFAGLQTPVTLHNQFDENKRRTRAMATIGDTVDFVNQYEYDALGKVVGIMQNDKRVAYAYNAAGQRTSMSVFSGTNKVFDTLCQYDDMGRPTHLMHAKDKTIFANYDYTWDIANRITGFDFSYLGDKDEKTAEYGYDKTSQLIEADYNAFQPDEAYEYDANGNRKAYETGKNNQLLSDGVFDYKYDDEGNRIEKVSKTGEMTKYVWDHRNRLIQVIMPKETIAYLYDFQNRVTRRNDKFFVHDGWQIVLTLDAKGNVKNRNLWGAGQDELIATNDQFTLCDLLGSVRDIVNADGKVLGHREYNAFGKVTRSTGKAESPFGYTGKMFDDATGLQWNINRWYDAEVGRWVSEDPIGFEGNDMNLFRYAANSPMIFVDPDGRWWNVLVLVYGFLNKHGAILGLTGITFAVIQGCNARREREENLQAHAETQGLILKLLAERDLPHECTKCAPGASDSVTIELPCRRDCRWILSSEVFSFYGTAEVTFTVSCNTERRWMPAGSKSDVRGCLEIGIA